MPLGRGLWRDGEAVIHRRRTMPMPNGTSTQYLNGTGVSTPFPSIPAVPIDVSAFINDSGYISTAPVQSVNGQTGAVSISIPPAQVNADRNAVSGISVVLNKPTIPTVVSRTFSAAVRALNTAFQVSTLSDAIVSYAVDVAVSISLAVGQAGQVILEYADNSAMTTNLVVVNSCTSGNTGLLTLGLSLTNTQTGTLSGVIPKNKFAMIKTVNVVGAPTFTFRSGQEVVF